MKTALEWLIDEHFGGIENCTPDFKNKINQAKEMEKEQIKNAYDAGQLHFWPDEFLQRSEYYYNETFKQQEQ